jgi:hypothetical protein
MNNKSPVIGPSIIINRLSLVHPSHIKLPATSITNASAHYLEDVFMASTMTLRNTMNHTKYSQQCEMRKKRAVID